ncbi:MAG: hypothetical protein EHM70_20875, partial [Chloroflexota bacterium]
DSPGSQTTIILAAHGAPATDYPSMRVGLLMAIEFSGRLAAHSRLLQRWRDALDHQIRAWPRTAGNDPYKAAVDALAAGLAAQVNHRVIAGYNEFCEPTIAAAIDQAAAGEARQIIVIPTMLLRGNQHTEAEIRLAVDDARRRYPGVEIHYAWPFDQEQLVGLFAGQIHTFEENSKRNGGDR